MIRMQNGMLVPDSPVNRMAKMAGGAFGVHEEGPTPPPPPPPPPPPTPTGVTISVAPARKLYAGDSGQSFSEPDFALVGRGGAHLTEMEVEPGTPVYLYADKVMTSFAAKTYDDISAYSGAVIGFEYSTDGGATFHQVRWQSSDVGDNFVTVESETIVRAIQVGRVNLIACYLSTTGVEYCTYMVQIQLADDPDYAFGDSVSVDFSDSTAVLVFSQMMLDVYFSFRGEGDYADYEVGDKSGTVYYGDGDNLALAIGNNWTPSECYTVCNVEDDTGFIRSNCNQ